MNPQALRFPRRLGHPSGKQLSLRPDHLLVQFTKAPDRDAVYRNVDKLGLRPEPDVRTRAVKRRGGVVREQLNETSRRLWFSAPRTLSRGPELVRSLEKAAKLRVEWIAPVYSAGAGKGPGSLVSPLPHVLLVRIPDGLTAHARDELLAGLRALGLVLDEKRSRYQRPYSYFVVDAPMEANAYEIKERLARGKHEGLDVRFEMMPMVKPTTMIPNDALYAQQWNMARIRAGGPRPTGWDLGTGHRSVVICILDEGCDLGHPDLRYASNGINLGSMSGAGSPTGNHGTACAGIAAATMNNLLGVAGVAGACRILPVAFQNWTDAEVAAGINYATDHGADVVSMSFGQYGPDDGIDPSGWDFGVIDGAIEDAHERGVVLVAASGNENSGAFNRYPARHELVIGVGASDQDDNRKSPLSPDGEDWGANYATGISVVAPGVRIPTTDRRGTAGYNRSEGAAGNYTLTFNGTSSATPHVAGLAALVKAICPTRSVADIRGIIERTAAKVGAVPYSRASGHPNGTRNKEMGYGRIDVDAATKEAMLYALACLTQA